jgi:catechol 1,2-dioxygenase
MNQVDSSVSSGKRLQTVFNDLIEDLKTFIRRNGLSYEEYHRAVEFLAQAGTAGEVPLLMDVFLEAVVDEVNYGGRPGTESNLEGPYYLAGAPLLKPPYILPQREDEDGEILFFSGTVRSTQGVPLVGALLDLWQAGASGLYSHFNYQEPRYNLRGQFYTDDKGRFEVRTVVPASYPIPTAGYTGSLLKALGRQPFQPAHLHLKLSHEGFEPLTTQLYFQGDPLLDSDVASAVKASLIATLTKHDSAADLEESGLNRPYFTLVYDFTLRPRID